MADASDSRPRRPVSTSSTSSTAPADAPSYFTSQSLRRPASVRQASTPSPQAGQQPPTSRPSSSRHASTSITSEPQQPPPLPDESTIRARQFSPLFTLVTDTTGPRPPRTHHPRVHYIFADDEDDEAFAAALASQGLSTPDTSSAASVRSHPGQSPRDRAIVLDLVPRQGEAGYDVKYVSSLGSDWAVTTATVGRMEGEGPVEGEGPLMLRIEGVGIEPGGAAARAQTEAEGRREHEDEAGEYAPLIDEFETRMGVLRKVVTALDERSRVVAEKEAHEEEVGHDEGGVPPWDKADESAG